MAMWGITPNVTLQLRDLWRTQVSVTSIDREKTKNVVKIAFFGIVPEKYTFLDFSQLVEVTKTWFLH